MAEYVEIAPDGIFVYRWNRKKKANVRKRAKKALICTHLRDRCEIAEGTTLGQFFEAVDRYKLLKLFIGQYSWCRDIDAFHAQAKEPVYEEPETHLDYLEIHRHANVEQNVEKVKNWGGKRETVRTVHFDDYYDFHAIGDPEKDDVNYAHYKEGEKIAFSISATPVNELVDLPIKLKKDFDVYDKFDPQRHVSGNGPEKLLTTEKNYTLLEVLDAVYYDISFHGGPAENKEFIENMRGMMDGIKNGDVLGIPLEQVTKRMDTSNGPLPEELLKGLPVPDGFKIVLHPDVARFFGVDPDSIPMDDKDIIRKGEEDDSGAEGD